MQTTCLFCGNIINLVYVHGHFQCPVCKTNALPCCDGDNCTNQYLALGPHNGESNPADKQDIRQQKDS